jgi:hypothetical protein
MFFFIVFVFKIENSTIEAINNDLVVEKNKRHEKENGEIRIRKIWQENE